MRMPDLTFVRKTRERARAAAASLRAAKFPSFSLKSKLALLCTSLFVALVGVLAGLQIYQQKQDITRLISDQQFTLLTLVAQDLDDKFAVRAHALSNAAATIPASIAEDAGELERHGGALTLLALFDDVYVISSKGVVLIDVPRVAGRRGVDVSQRDYFRQTIETGRPVISPPFLGRTLKQPGIMMTAPVVNESGEVVAVLGGFLNLMKPNFLGSLGSAKIGNTGYFYVVTKDLVPIMVSHPLKQTVMQPVPAPAAHPSLAQAVAGFEGTLEGVNDRGVRGLFSYKSLRTTNWLLAAVMAADEAYAPIVVAQRRMTWISAALALTIAPLIWLLAYRLIAPLAALRDNIREIRRLPDSAEELLTRNDDEIGDLTREFNSLMRERRLSEEAVRGSEGMLRTIADSMPALIGYIGRDERYRFNNKTYEHWYGVPREQMYGRTMREVLGDAQYAEVAERVSEVLAGKAVTHEREYTLNGTTRHVRSTYLPHFSSRKEVLGFYVLVNDISEQKEVQQRLQHMVQHDSLTGLPNRALFRDRLAQAIERSRRCRRPMAVMYLDIDHFKSINDTQGHAVGDGLLRGFAERLQGCVRSVDTVARLGGDEFAIILEELNADEACAVATKLVTAMESAFNLPETSIAVTASVGVAFLTGADEDGAALLKRADQALYQAKEHGRNTYRLAA